MSSIIANYAYAGILFAIPFAYKYLYDLVSRRRPQPKNGFRPPQRELTAAERAAWLDCVKDFDEEFRQHEWL